MPTLTLHHQQTTEAGFVAILNIDGQSQYSVTVSDPFTEQQERELEFYFEQWIRCLGTWRTKRGTTTSSISTPTAG
ncbi:CHAT domain-containing protein [Leptolyngbya sp. BL0902]|uniref:hypothetical protein n=1 Tax=Leptolyngbya sp. BL0902 TaxID=1115757 RepID=UPI0018E6E77E|nr:hypothetical protein [Leptolyngbya sp. BL0902]QQE65881.1 CHAT domain-containing protein [Leptolyngbya sp. BL0902]